MASSYLERYVAGDTVAVWAEIGPLRVGLRGVDDDLAGVVVETMRRVGHNCELIARRLPQIGYRFGWYDARTVVPEWAGPIVPYCKGNEIARAVGSVPVTLAQFLAVVGNVSFVGYHSDWSVAYPDPLVVELAPVPDLRTEYEDWMDYRMQEGHSEPFELAIAPDWYHKANVSGGPAYGFELPCETVDSPLLNEPGNGSLVSYLRRAFAWGGFPGFERVPSGDVPHDHLAYLRHGLLAI